MDDKFWNVGNLMALGVREIVKRHEAEVAELRDQLTQAESQRDTAGDLVDGMDATVAALRAELAAERDRAGRFDGSAQALSRTIDDMHSEITGVQRRLAKAEAERDATRAELAAIRDGLAMLKGAETVESVVMERNSLQVQLDNARATLAAARQPKYNPDDVAFRAAHAVLPVPQGVPPLRDLREIGVDAYLSYDAAKRENAGCMVDPMGAAAAAIRDAVLAGLGAEWSDAQIELLANQIDRQIQADGGADSDNIARAAVAHIGAVPRPAGLPSAEELNAAIWGSRDVVAAAERTLKYLAPWLRDPTGWELGFNTDDLQKAIEDIFDSTQPISVGVAVLMKDIRSRIRPTFECPKCVRRKQLGRTDNEDLLNRINAARAALEGE